MRFILRFIATALGFSACDSCERIDWVDVDVAYAKGWRVTRLERERGEYPNSVHVACPECAP